MERLRFLRWSPWLRAPLLAFRSPALFVGVGVAGVVLGLAAGSRPVFVSSAASGALRQDLAKGCPYDVGLRVVRQAAVPAVGASPPIAPAPGAASAIDLGAAESTLVGAVRGTPHLGTEVTTVFGGNAEASIAGNTEPPQQIALVARRGAAQHIHILSAVASPGIWLPDTTAARLHAVAGSLLDLRVGAAVVPIAVHGIFRDLLLERDQFWCSLQPQIEVFGNATTPPVAVLDQPQLMEVLQQTEKSSVTAWWEFPPDARNWTMSAARAVQAHLGSVAASSQDPNSRLAKAVGVGLAHLDLPASIQHAQETEAAVASAVGPVSLASVAVAVLVIIAASGTWLERRRVELRVLAIRGASPGALAAKAMLELSVPTLAGAAAGLAVAVTTVRWFGPSAMAEPRAVLVASVSALVAALLGLAVGAVVVATRVRNLNVRSGVLGEKERLPLWELIVLALAAAAYYELRTRGGAVVSSGPVQRVDGLVLLFPVLMLAGTAGLIARVALSRRLLSVAARHLPTSGWLAARRLEAGRWRAAPMVTATAVSIGIVMFGASLAASLRATVGAKTTLAPGAAQVFNLQVPVPVPPADPAAAHSTLVTVTAEGATTAGHPASVVLGVEPATFARAAFWESSFAGASLPNLLRRLSDHPDTGPVPVIAVGRSLPDRLTIALPGDKGTLFLPARVVGRANAFPGQQTSRDLLVVNRAALTRIGVTEAPQIWVNSTDLGLTGRLKHAGVPIFAASRASDVAAGSALEPQLWALDYLQVIGLAAGAVTLCGVGLYFAANARRRRLGTALALRLGVKARTAHQATLAEVAALLTGGLVVGVGLAWLAVALVFSRLDPLPNSPPSPLFRFDAITAVWCVAGAAVSGIVLTAIVERSSSARPLPELLRDAR
ncbi:MAG: putative transport system permease protein [Acidimicrobiaceae bacterium]|nr:putative transport system permease protein [Acidimicrobiaceae bacterium]